MCGQKKRRLWVPLGKRAGGRAGADWDEGRGTRRKEEKKLKVVNKMNEGVCLRTLKGPGRAKFRDSNGTQMRNQKPVLETSPRWGGGSPDKRGGIRSAALLLFWPP